MKIEETPNSRWPDNRRVKGNYKIVAMKEGIHEKIHNLGFER